MLSWLEHEKSFINKRPDLDLQCSQKRINTGSSGQESIMKRFNVDKKKVGSEIFYIFTLAYMSPFRSLKANNILYQIIHSVSINEWKNKYQ